MSQAITLSAEDLIKVLNYISTRNHAPRNRAMILLTHYAGLRVGEVACLRWKDVLTADGAIKEEIRLLPDMTKGRQSRTVYVNGKLREELKRYVDSSTIRDDDHPVFYSQKGLRTGFTANSLSQTFARIYKGAGIDGASSHSGRRTFLTNLANKNTPIHLLKVLAGHKSITTTAAYLYASPIELRAAVEKY